MLHQPGEIIGDRYRVLALLGQGGTGTTYRAEDIRDRQPVALKAISFRQISDWKALELFEREARVLENLHHPAIPRYITHFQIDLPSDRRFYLVQELATGESLASLVQRGWRATEAEVQEIAIQVLTILNYLHWLTPPVIHRDIKPQNLIRRPDGQIMVVDFGSVRDVYRHTLTAGTFVGTVGYMPPEQFRGQAYFATDLYGLGATLLFLLTHRSPAELPQARMRLVFRDRIAVSDGFADWLETMLEPAIEDRFHSAEEAIAALQRPAVAPRLQATPSPTDSVWEPAPVHAITRDKPKNARMNIYQQGDRLIIEIAAMPWNRWTLAMLRRTLISGMLTALLMIGIWLKPVVVIFAIPTAISGLVDLTKLLLALNGTIQLTIDPHVFEIRWKCWSWRQSKLGRTATLRSEMWRAKEKKRYNPSRYYTDWLHYASFRLSNGPKLLLFIAGREESELAWLESEIDRFVTPLQAHIDPEQYL